MKRSEERIVRLKGPMRDKPAHAMRHDAHLGYVVRYLKFQHKLAEQGAQA